MIKQILYALKLKPLTLSWGRPLSNRNQPINLLRKSMDWFLYDNDFRHEKVNALIIINQIFYAVKQ